MFVYCSMSNALKLIKFNKHLYRSVKESIVFDGLIFAKVMSTYVYVLSFSGLIWTVEFEISTADSRPYRNLLGQLAKLYSYLQKCY